jgi:hypothetical protein
MKYGLLCKMLPKEFGGEPTYRMHGPVFDSKRDALEEQRKLRVQNLPFTSSLVSITDIEPS